MATSVFPAPSTGSSPTTLPIAVPAGLTLRNTYTSSQTGLSFPVSEVFVVLVGGGGGGTYGNGGANGVGSPGGGGGAVQMGWVPAFTACTIGAGGSSDSRGGTSRIGMLLAFGGGGGATNFNGLGGSAGGGAGGGHGPATAVTSS